MRILREILVGTGLLQACQAWPHHKGNGLPIVDLGYELYQATSYNASTGIYKFANIRFARSPAGELRFRAPQPPEINRSVIQDGSFERTCPQAVPTWQNNAFIPLAEYSNGGPFNLSGWEAGIAEGTTIPISQFLDGNIEDCLFLDVYVPRKVLERAETDPGRIENVPVLFWVGGIQLTSTTSSLI
ncbi:MAG: hypothetical protein Q9214_006380, partial [Letrouitia sp. 1 TL-2023]